MDTDDTVECDPPLPQGRPRTIAPVTVQVCVTLPVQQFDHIYAQATRDRCSIPEVIRRRLAQFPSKK